MRLPSCALRSCWRAAPTSYISYKWLYSHLAPDPFQPSFYLACQVCGFSLKPDGFFSCNPAIDLPPSRDTASREQLAEGGGGGGSAAAGTCCIKSKL